MDQMREIAEKHDLTMLQLACLWNLAQPAVKCVIPTLIQEIEPARKPIEAKVDELAELPEIPFTTADCEFINRIGDNRGCMELKGGHPGHLGEPQADRWSLTPDLEATGQRWEIDPRRDLVSTHG
jgi:hypothetical protein